MRLERERTPGRKASLERLRALLLLGGAVRPGPLVLATGRPIADLPVAPGRSLLDLWLDEARSLAAAFGIERLPVRLMLHAGARPPRLPETNGLVRLGVEHDPREFRGTAGILRDATAEYDGDDLVLVANVAQILRQPLKDLAAALASARADVSVVAHRDGTPSGLMLLRCGCLRLVPEVGFVDMKEQALPAIAQRHEVKAIEWSQATAQPLRTLEDYIEALTGYHRRADWKSACPPPFSERWNVSFALAEGGARVEHGARLHDAVVLKGAWVQRGAFVARSVVCSGGVVRRGRTVVNRLVSPLSE